MSTPQKPTAIGQGTIPAVVTDTTLVVETTGINPDTTSLATPVEQQQITMTQRTVTSQNSIPLREDQVGAAEKILATLHFETMGAAEIALIGHEAERQLTATLDGFMDRISRTKNPQIFGLFDRLKKGVADAKLPNLLAEIRSGKVPIGTRIRGWFSADAAAKAVQTTYEATCDLVTGRTNTLSGVMRGLEAELTTAMESLLKELQAFGQLKDSYKTRIDEFAIIAAVSQVFLANARVLVDTKRHAYQQSPNALARTELEELETKLQLLQSRALALEGVYTNLPADNMVIQQIELAGVQTLQETATTATARFNSIKTTLIALHGALQVKGVQRLTAEHAELDRQLSQLRGALTREVVQEAANAPGDNRLMQAQKLEEVIKLTEELQTLVETARTNNTTKFEQAEKMFAAARTKLTTLSTPKN